MFVRKIVGGITGLTATGVKTGVSAAEKILVHGRDTASGAATAGTTVAGTVVRSTVGRFRPAGLSAPATPDEHQDSVTDEPTAVSPASDGGTPPVKAAPPKKAAAKKAAPKKAVAKEAPVKKSAAKKSTPGKKAAGPRPVTAADLPLPDLPEEPPVDVVEQALRAEESGEALREGFATEPKGASRDETHGDAALQRAEVEELAEEMVEASPEGSVDIETPVGTTGADVAFNPDTAEADLQQPATEPLLDPSLTKQVIADAEIGAGDADPRKG